MTVTFHYVFVFQSPVSALKSSLFTQSLASLSWLWGVTQNSNKLLSLNHRGRFLSEGAQLVLPSRVIFYPPCEKGPYFCLCSNAPMQNSYSISPLASAWHFSYPLRFYIWLPREQKTQALEVLDICRIWGWSRQMHMRPQSFSLFMAIRPNFAPV